MLIAGPLGNLLPRCNLNLSYSYPPAMTIGMTCALPQCYLITTAHQIVLAYLSLPLVLAAPLCLPLALRNIKSWLEPVKLHSTTPTNHSQYQHNHHSPP
jgi:hypothetical protein